MDQVTSEHAVDLAAPARVGREQQLYKDGVRQSAGCIPVKYEENRVWVLMVQSTKKDDWILPKGGWETDETQEQAAIRETYEESGAVGDLGVFLGCYQASITKPTKIDIYFYLMRVTQLLESWPEGQSRGRKWFPLEEALESSTRPEICNVLQHLHKLIISSMTNALSVLSSATKLQKTLIFFAAWQILRRLFLAIKNYGKKVPPEVHVYLPFGLDRIIRAMWKFGQPYDMFEEYRRKHGNTFQFGILGRSQVSVFDPSSIQHFLAKNWENYEKGPHFRTVFQPLLGLGIFNVNGDLWKFHRQTARPHFDKVELNTMVPTFTKHGGHLLQYLDKASKKGTVLDMQDIFFRFTLDSVGEILFGHNIDSLNTENQFAMAFDSVQQIVSWRFLTHPLWKLASTKKFDTNLETIDRFVEKVIDDCINDPKLSDRQDLLAEYVRSNPPPTRDYLKDMLRNMLIAGRDTTAILLTWFFYELSLHPEVEAQVVEEIDRVFGQEPPTGKKLDELRYLKNALNETLRLHPSVPTDVRTAVKDDVLPNGYVIEAGTTVFYHAYLTHRMKELWGPDADVFDPTRFDPERIRQVPNFAFVPFHAGPRICLGQNMAYTEAKVAAVLILQRYRLRLQHGFHPQYRSTIILQSSNGMKMTVEARK